MWANKEFHLSVAMGLFDFRNFMFLRGGFLFNILEQCFIELPRQQTSWWSSRLYAPIIFTIKGNSLGIPD